MFASQTEIYILGFCGIFLSGLLLCVIYANAKLKQRLRDKDLQIEKLKASLTTISLSYSKTLYLKGLYEKGYKNAKIIKEQVLNYLFNSKDVKNAITIKDGSENTVVVSFTYLEGDINEFF